MRKQEGHQAWIVGIVEVGQRDAKVIDRPRIIEVITGDDGSVQVFLCFPIFYFKIKNFKFFALNVFPFAIKIRSTNHIFILQLWITCK